jgi:chorismate synthase
MSSSYHGQLNLTIFGQSHAPAVGMTLEGLPPGETIDLALLQKFLDRRAPGRNPWATPRREADEPEFLSGLVDGHTCGTPVTAIIRNENTRSGDYENLRQVPRPGHGDFTAQRKFHGAQDVAGGGHFSGRLTAPLCIAGGLCLQVLRHRGITIAAHIAAIGGIADVLLDPVGLRRETLEGLTHLEFPVLDAGAGEAMEHAIENAKHQGDSLGGIIECAVLGLPAGLGDPIFDGMENRIARLVFGIPAVKGLEFGAGFAAAGMRGSLHNDPFYAEHGVVKTRSNHHGGILGGITTGMPLLFRTAVKPTPSIAKPQESVNLETGEATVLEVKGRHDPCIVPRAVPCMEAAAAIAVLDALLEQERNEHWEKGRGL